MDLGGKSEVAVDLGALPVNDYDPHASPRRLILRELGRSIVRFKLLNGFEVRLPADNARHDGERGNGQRKVPQ